MIEMVMIMNIIVMAICKAILLKEVMQILIIAHFNAVFKR
jgi:hypothetical protein